MIGFASDNLVEEVVQVYNCSIVMQANRPYSFFWYWTGTSLQVRFMQRVLSNANDISLHEPPLQASSSPISRI